MLHPNDIVGVGVLDDPSGKFDLDGQIFPHTELPPDGGRDVGDAIPYDPKREKQKSEGTLCITILKRSS